MTAIAPKITTSPGQVTIEGWTPQRVRDEWATYEKAQRMPVDHYELAVIDGVGVLMLLDTGMVMWQPKVGVHGWRVLQSAA